MVLIFVLCLVLGTVFNLAASLFIDSEQLPMLALGLKSIIVILGSVAIMRLLFKADRLLKLGWSETRKVKLSLAGGVFGIALVLVSFTIVFIVGEVDVVSLRLDRTILASFAVLTIVALIDTITEEVLFRGYVQEMIKSDFGVWPAILLSAVPFAILHSLGHDIFSHPLVIINLALAGVFLALLREWSGSLWLPIGVHFTWNAFNRLFGESDRIITTEFGPNEWISGGMNGFENGLANTLIMITVVVVLSFRLKKDRSSKPAVPLSTSQ